MRSHFTRGTLAYLQVSPQTRKSLSYRTIWAFRVGVRCVGGWFYQAVLSDQHIHINVLALKLSIAPMWCSESTLRRAIMVFDSLATILFVASVYIVCSPGTFRTEVSIRLFQPHHLVVFRHRLGKPMLRMSPY
ncbi:hypothetical protein PILCRDRAFT_113610 [Piloderma croceum F 1598]|uniref:Uncharacterized protein n=1 Tax=Piloderma croceum (strain F 1598) TaxID=765440 RepID=A0A0C3CR85_PILCF|nr:hypothetical protein PILCRDRAFT_113610 [Piloderma croceum F 1598]